jgi:hypothetical protein
MKRKLLVSLAALTLGAAFGFVTPVMAFRGGGGFGGMHGGGFGGMHGGGGFAGMHGGGGFAGVRSGGMFLGNRGFHGGFQGSMAVRGAAFAPAVHRFGGAPVGFRHNLAFRHVGFRNRHFRNVAFFGAPFFYGGYSDGCWRQVWTSYGWQWANLCGDYGY